MKMTSDEMQTIYRSHCQYRRRGHIVEQLQDQEWKPVDVPGPLYNGWDGKMPKGVNRAKRFVRSLPAGSSYTI